MPGRILETTIVLNLIAALQADFCHRNFLFTLLKEVKNELGGSFSCGIRAGACRRGILLCVGEKLPSAGGKLDSVGLIRNGAFAFLRREYRILAIFAGVVSLVILLFFPVPFWQGNILENVKMVAAYLFGSVLSGISGYVGISIATIANVKAASAARKGLAPSFMAGFRGGAVMGMAVVSASLAGAAVLYLLTSDANVVLAFSFGASSLALFAQSGRRHLHQNGRHRGRSHG